MEKSLLLLHVGSHSAWGHHDRLRWRPYLAGSDRSTSDNAGMDGARNAVYLFDIQLRKRVSVIYRRLFDVVP